MLLCGQTSCCSCPYDYCIEEDLKKEKRVRIKRSVANTKQSQWQRNYRKKRVEEHKCQRCGQPLPDNYSFKTCHKCAEKMKEYREKRRKTQQERSVSESA